MRYMEICRKSVNFSDISPNTLVYYITIDALSDACSETAPEIYGVGVSIVESGETKVIDNVTCSQCDIVALAELLAIHLVTPVTLADVVCDWLAEQ